MADGLRQRKRPAGYEPPQWERVSSLLSDVKKSRQAKIDRIREIKHARRDQWDSTIAKIPSSFRKTLPPLGFPDLEDMLLRLTGMIAKQQPMVQVIPPSGADLDVRKAGKEEARLHGLRITIQDQQDRDIYAMGIDAQLAWGESWISVWPDPLRFRDPGDEDAEESDEKKAVKEAERIVGAGDFARQENESAGDYIKRYGRIMAGGRVPICIEDHDPQTVYDFWSQNRLAIVIVETEHTVLDIEIGLGYRPIRRRDTGERKWALAGKTISEPYVSEESGTGGTDVVDTNHDSGVTDGGRPQGKKVKCVVYCDEWCFQRYLDGVLVEQWEHDWGFVPMFPAAGEQSSDRDPAYKTRSVIDGALVIAKQIVLWSAVMASSGMQHGWPTPFLKNPEHGITGPRGEPTTRTVRMGELNLLGPNEDIVFPYLDAKMGPDFVRHMEFLLGRLENTTMNAFGRDVSPETSGYAVAQIRALYLSMVGTVYTNACRQWRKLFYALRYIVRDVYPGGVYLRGAVETERKDDGREVQYRPVLEYAKEHTTDFTIEVDISEGIVQDEMANRKSAIEMYQAGIWSKRRAQEETGVENPAAENDEIATDRLMNSPAADQQVMIMAMAMAAERYQASRTDMSSPFMQALMQAQQQLMGGGPEQPAGAPVGPGQFQNQGAEPGNALPGGQPMQQNPGPAAPQQGGPTQGPKAEDYAVPKMPGGVKGGNAAAVV